MWTYNYAYPDELYHYGILGQKWGVRRYQNADGSLTTAGKNHYAKKEQNESFISQSVKAKKSHDNNSDSSSKNKEENEGLTDEQKDKIKKAAMVAGGVTLAAAAVYVGHNTYIKQFADGVIKEGTSMQVIANDPDKNLGRAFYLAYKKGDMAKYEGLYGKQLSTPQLGKSSTDVYKIGLEAASDIKIISNDKAKKIFNDLSQNDPEFINALNRSFGYSNFKNSSKNSYDAFNRALVVHDEETTKAANIFYSKIKEKGYQALYDVNDRDYTGYKSKAPVIVIDKFESITKTGATQVAKDEVNKKYAQQMRKLYVENSAKEIGALAAGVGTVSAGIKWYNSKRVESYKSEHPNTKLSDKEIYEMLSL